MVTDTSNINFKLATDFIYYTNTCVFLTGKAGTGKTTFLKFIKQNSIKQMAIVAPTGVAAINAGGVTIHSFFQLPFTPYVPSKIGFSNNDSIDKHHLLGRLRINADRKKIFEQLELLVIDEISMVRCDVLDAIDTILKHFKKNYSLPFGGVQVLLIGDMFQLPPVVQDVEWQILKDYYETPYFFSSLVMQQCSLAYIELNKIYRQQDEAFISILNKVRNNELDEVAYQMLQKNYQPNFLPNKSEDGYITLTTHNYKADAINAEQLLKLKGDIFSFKAEIEPEFNEKSYPADEVLQLKIGAQVMFIKNDLEKVRRYYNGKIGTVEKIENDKIYIQCKNEETLIEIKKHKWENIKYSINKQHQKVEEEVIGSFTQYPLRLAWAITIHKSQGLTFEKAIIDAEKAFAPGQVYVALSRCVSLQGLVLLSQISASSLFADERIIAFAHSYKHLPLQQNLQASKQVYQTELLEQVFCFDKGIKYVDLLKKLVQEHQSTFSNYSNNFISSIDNKTQELQSVFIKFKPHLQFFFAQQILPEENIALQEKIKKAAVYFTNHLLQLQQLITTSNLITDSKQVALAYNEYLKQFFVFVAQLQQIMNAFTKGFFVSAYYGAKQNFSTPNFLVNAYATANTSIKKVTSTNPNLYKQLKQLRDTICNKQNLPIYFVANTNSLEEMSNYLPLNITDLKKISGFGQAKADKFGLQFLDIIVRYVNEHNLTSSINNKPSKPERKEKIQKEDTKNETYKLFKQGKTIQQIADERKLSTGTIETHIAHFIATEKISIAQLLLNDKVQLIATAIEENKQPFSLSHIKQQLGNNISFAEIKFVQAYLQVEKLKKPAQ